ncbi:MAG: NAD-binding oxidoreductase, partial [Gammaproteobacteria bacterium]|nr:NAD-binding oxidoreductase [Gammaproteobacteria bacterium]
MGPLPLEMLRRNAVDADLSSVNIRQQLEFQNTDNSDSLVNAMRTYAKYMDAARNGPVSEQRPEIPSCLEERAKQLKSLGYFMDALHVGCSNVFPKLFLPSPYINKDLAELPADWPGFHHHNAHGLQEGIDQNTESIEHHSHALVLVYDHSREVQESESGFDWLFGSGRHRASLRAAETAVVVANFIRALGFEARVHTESTTDIDLAKAAVSAGAAEVDKDGTVTHPYLGKQFAIAVVTTTLEFQADKPLASRGLGDKFKSHGPSWWFGGGMGLGKGMGTQKNAFNLDQYKNRSFEADVFSSDKLKRQDTPTSIIDEARIPRLPKRSDIFWRGMYGDMGKAVQDANIDDFCVVKTPISEAQFGLIGALHLLERREPAATLTPGYEDPAANAKKIKSALHFLGADMVGISRAPDWVWYSHDLDGKKIEPAHDNAITLLIDQGHETMEGASGDDWIAVS